MGNFSTCGSIEHSLSMVLLVSALVYTGRMDDTSLPGVPTIRHAQGHLLLSHDSGGVRCGVCSAYRSTLSGQNQRLLWRKWAPLLIPVMLITGKWWSIYNGLDINLLIYVHAFLRYKSPPDLIGRLNTMHRQYCIVTNKTIGWRRRSLLHQRLLGYLLMRGYMTTWRRLLPPRARSSSKDHWQIHSSVSFGNSRLRQPHRRMHAPCVGIHSWYAGAYIWDTGEIAFLRMDYRIC